LLAGSSLAPRFWHRRGASTQICRTRTRADEVRSVSSCPRGEARPDEPPSRSPEGYAGGGEATVRSRRFLASHRRLPGGRPHSSRRSMVTGRSRRFLINARRRSGRKPCSSRMPLGATSAAGITLRARVSIPATRTTQLLPSKGYSGCHDDGEVQEVPRSTAAYLEADLDPVAGPRDGEVQKVPQQRPPPSWRLPGLQPPAPRGPSPRR
jgi:hypothetical protein